MATSKQHNLVAAVEHEISCPICYEVFEEPKCLPNCAHNVCQHCLEGMVKKTINTIECPVCRVESIIPKGGVAAFPKNHLLVRLIEQSPGRIEKQSLKQAVKNCNEKLEGVKSALKEMEDRYVTTTKQDEETKQKIQSLAENVVRMVREQERKMLDEMNLRQNRNKGTMQSVKSSAVESCENASGCIQTVQEVIQNRELMGLKSLKDALVEQINDFSKSLEKRMLEANREFTQLCDVSLTLTDTGSVEKLIEDERLLGKLNTGPASTPQEFPTASVMSDWQATPDSPRSKDYSRCGSLIHSMDSTSVGIAEFNPFSVAVSRDTGHFVVLDDEMKRVHIFNELGEALNSFHIKHGNLFDIAVSSEDEIVVVNRETNQLLHYDMNGNFRKNFNVTAPPKKVKFTSLSVDIHGRFIISSRPVLYNNETEDDVMPCILVFSPSGSLAMSFGEVVLLSPKKAMFLNGKFYVTDSALRCVVVFDKNGNFLETFGGDHLELPRGIAADYSNENLLVSDIGNSTVQIYSQAGEQLHCFGTDDDPLQVAFTENYNNILICYDSYMQMLTYC